MTYSEHFEWFLAAQWAGYPFDKFRQLEGQEQAEVVAAYRCKNQMDAVVSAVTNRKIESTKNRTPTKGRPKR